jgi:hypothetical protein
MSEVGVREGHVRDVDDGWVLDLYRAMSWQDLVTLRHTFTCDLHEASREAIQKRTFLTRRIALLDRVLLDHQYKR